jgi:carboxymethylenebutenolidase
MAASAQAVSFPSGGSQLEGYLARPDGDGPLAAVVVIHELLGLNENMRDIARRFAEQGYVALAVDLFSRGNRLVCMVRLMSGLFFNTLDHTGIRDLRAALSFLAGQPDVDASRLGAIGFCMGGSFAIAWACTDNRLKAIAPYYGMNPRPLEAVARACPVVGSYPEKDFLSTSYGVRLDAALARYGIPHDIKFYPHTKHAFFNDRRPRYDAAASQDSWQRVLAFFREHIG